MKPASPFSKLPSLGELLQHPTVQGVVQRVNQTTIAQRAAGFLDELQTGWRSQDGGPSLSELAERLAQRLLGGSQHGAPLVNATGVLCSQQWQAPWSEAAMQELLRSVSDYQQPAPERMEQVCASLVQQTGAEAAWVASGWEAAVALIEQNKLEANVVVRPLIGLIDPADFGQTHVETIAQTLAAGADLVVVDGAGLLGGPRCGIVVGAKRWVTELEASQLAPALVAQESVVAALEATLASYRAPESMIHQVPMLQLLSTPLENLQQRCERIAPLLAECEAVASAEVVSRPSVWLDEGASQQTSPSWAIVVRPAEMPVDRFARSLAAASPRVIGYVEQEAYRLDFRALFPRWDQGLVAAVEQMGRS